MPLYTDLTEDQLKTRIDEISKQMDDLIAYRVDHPLIAEDLTNKTKNYLTHKVFYRIFEELEIELQGLTEARTSLHY